MARARARAGRALGGCGEYSACTRGGPPRSRGTDHSDGSSRSVIYTPGLGTLGSQGRGGRTPNMTLVEELPEDEAGFSSKPSASDEADVTRAEAGTSVEHRGSCRETQRRTSVCS